MVWGLVVVVDGVGRERPTNVMLIFRFLMLGIINSVHVGCRGATGALGGTTGVSHHAKHRKRITAPL